MLLKIAGKVSLDRNTMYSLIVHRIHDYWYYSLFLLLVIVYTITVYCYCTVTISSKYLGNMDIDCFNRIK